MQLFVSYIDEQQVNRFCQYNIYIILKREVATMIPAAQEILAINNINWKFIPVGRPYFGRVLGSSRQIYEAPFVERHQQHATQYGRNVYTVCSNREEHEFATSNTDKQ